MSGAVGCGLAHGYREEGVYAVPGRSPNLVNANDRASASPPPAAAFGAVRPHRPRLGLSHRSPTRLDKDPHPHARAERALELRGDAQVDVEPRPAQGLSRRAHLDSGEVGGRGPAQPLPQRCREAEEGAVRELDNDDATAAVVAGGRGAGLVPRRGLRAALRGRSVLARRAVDADREAINLEDQLKDGMTLPPRGGLNRDVMAV